MSARAVRSALWSAVTTSIVGVGCATAVATSGPPAIPASLLPASSEVVLVGAGDISSCDNDEDDDTAALVGQVLAAAPLGFAFTAGDNVYPNGAGDLFERCYEPTWGAFKDRTLPTPGNHDYRTLDASAYFAYFGAAAGAPGSGWHSRDVGAWHVVLLNSNCAAVGGCAADSPQGLWLAHDLDESQARCTIAIWHHPLFSSGTTHGDDPSMRELYRMLDAHNADVVVAGHEHVYERFDGRTADGAPGGLVSFIAGTGGRSHYAFGDPKPGSQVRIADRSGVLVLTLHPDSYSWRFIDTTGASLDEGSAACR